MQVLPAYSGSMSLPIHVQHSPAAERNKDPIARELLQILPAQGSALEIASGTGQHLAFFASAMPSWMWQPSDLTDASFPSIAAWCRQAGVTNVRVPVTLDVLAPRWPTEGAGLGGAFDAIYCANMLHIAPWATCAGLMRGAARHLTPHGVLVTYGPYLEPGVPTSPGNRDFDRSLQERDPQWGIRSIDAVVREAGLVGLHLARRVAMPANNLLLVFDRRGAGMQGEAVGAG